MIPKNPSRDDTVGHVPCADVGIVYAGSSFFHTSLRSATTYTWYHIALNRSNFLFRPAVVCLNHIHYNRRQPQVPPEGFLWTNNKTNLSSILPKYWWAE